MKIDELIGPGDKIDLQLVGQIEQKANGKEIEVRIFKSMLLDFVSDTEIEIAMPTEGSKMVLFNVGLRCSLVLYTEKGMYNCIGLVKQRYKKDNLYMLVMEIKTPLSKYQRREFFRVQCMIDMTYYQVPEEVTTLQTTEELFQETLKSEYFDAQNCGIIKDISGGGLRFISSQKHEKGDYLLIVVRLTNEKIDETFYLLAQVISSDSIESSNLSFVSRAKFIFKDIKDREKIVKYVFEEERRIRKKVSG